MTTLDESVVKAIQDIAPLYEAETVLRTWLRHNGIIYALGKHGEWVTWDNREGYKGNYLPVFDSFTQMLAFALDHATKHIEEQAALKLVKVETS